MRDPYDQIGETVAHEMFGGGVAQFLAGTQAAGLGQLGMVMGGKAQQTGTKLAAPATRSMAISSSGGGIGPAARKIIDQFVALMCKVDPKNCAEYRRTYAKPAPQVVNQIALELDQQVHAIAERATRWFRRPVSKREVLADIYKPQSQIVGIV